MGLSSGESKPEWIEILFQYNCNSCWSHILFAIFVENKLLFIHKKVLNYSTRVYSLYIIVSFNHGFKDAGGKVLGIRLLVAS